MNEFAIHGAAWNGDVEKVRQLIEAGVPVDSLDEDGRTPLHRAARYGQYEVAGLLINSKCSINLKDHYGRTPVMLAAIFGQRDIVDLLLHHGAQVNCVSPDGTLLHQATKKGWRDIVRLILFNGEADPNAVGQDGDTPLILAARCGSAEVTALLIRARADVNLSGVILKRTALHWAAAGGHTDAIQVLLEKEGLHLSPRDATGDTPLHLACWKYEYRKKTTKLLLDAGADPNVENNQGETALNICTRRGNITHEEIGFFVQKGAYLKNFDYEFMSQDLFVKKNVLKNVELCTQSVVNKFNRHSLPALKGITYFARRLPNVNNFELRARHIDDVKNLVKCEIERHTFCNVVKVRPIALSALCVLSLITCHSGKKRPASTSFGHSPFKKNHT